MTTEITYNCDKVDDLSEVDGGTQSISLSCCKLQCIDGVQKAANLSKLSITVCKLKELGPLSGAEFPSLTCLILSYNFIESVEPLKSLFFLKQLSVSNNFI